MKKYRKGPQQKRDSLRTIFNRQSPLKSIRSSRARLSGGANTDSKLGDKEFSLQACNPLCAYSEFYAFPLDDRVIVERIEEKEDNSGRIMTPDIAKENDFYDAKGHQYHKSYSVLTGKKDTVSFCLLTICIQ